MHSIFLKPTLIFWQPIFMIKCTKSLIWLFLKSHYGKNSQLFLQYTSMNFKTTIFVAVLLISIALTHKTAAQSLPDSTITKINKLFSQWDTTNSPGCSVGIIRNDSLIFAKGYGMANLEYGLPITPATIFHMASISKQFTAYSIVLLAKQGKLGLDDDIHKYLSRTSRNQKGKNQ